jgi:hypothetical protein
MNATATPKRVTIKLKAEWTGFLKEMTPIAPTTTSTADVTNTSMLGMA